MSKNIRSDSIMEKMIQRFKQMRKKKQVIQNSKRHEQRYERNTEGLL